jgi:hypothetical protein
MDGPSGMGHGRKHQPVTCVTSCVAYYRSWYNSPMKVMAISSDTQHINLSPTVATTARIRRSVTGHARQSANAWRSSSLIRAPGQTQVGARGNPTHRTQALAFGRKHERRTTRRGRDPDARFLEEHQSAMPDDSSTSPVSGSGSRFYAGACVRSGRTRRSDAWQCNRQLLRLAVSPFPPARHSV